MNSRTGMFQSIPHTNTDSSQEDKRRAQVTNLAAAPAAGGTALGTQKVADKRRNPRFKCEGSVEFRTEGVDMRTRAMISDISLRGCYVELPATSAVNTTVNMVLDVKGVRVPLRGVVRTSFPLLGMGIEFTDIQEEDKAAIEEVLLRLRSGDPTPSEPTSVEERVAAPDLLMIVDPVAALNALAKFFHDHQTLGRKQFAELIGGSQNQNYVKQRTKDRNPETDFELR